ncbi:MAG TPA: chemotaxis protein CheX [Bryobacteraceae bacterium]|nr:chemotaxis protein CheX [Bryobacteraceae bacterium]
MKLLITHEDLVVRITAATREVFSTMLGNEAIPGVARTEDGGVGPTEGVVALVGLTGPLVGTGSFCCTHALACRLASDMLMSEYGSVDNDVLDVVGEVANMIIGNLKTSIDDQVGTMWLSVPTVVYGRNFTTRSMGRHNWTVVPFLSRGEAMQVQMFLTEANDLTKLMRPSLTVLQKGCRRASVPPRYQI